MEDNIESIHDLDGYSDSHMSKQHASLLQDELKEVRRLLTQILEVLEHPMYRAEIDLSKLKP